MNWPKNSFDLNYVVYFQMITACPQNFEELVMSVTSHFKQVSEKCELNLVKSIARIGIFFKIKCGTTRFSLNFIVVSLNMFAFCLLFIYFI